MSTLNSRLEMVTDRIRKRSAARRQAYVSLMKNQAEQGVNRQNLACTNLVHGYAGCTAQDKDRLRGDQSPNIGIVSAYNDMLSAHQPLERFPGIIKQAAHEVGAVAQFAGGVPAMCDGVTQGQPGMDLSLFSRDTIAFSTAIALSHRMFDAVLCVGICDKIVPGMLIGALSFGHLPTLFVPGGPMPSGQTNDDKAHLRELYAQGKVTRTELLQSEEKSYHSPGTCNFYGTANSNQMLMEIMGLHLPGSSFVNPNTPLRDALTALATKRVLQLTAMGSTYTPLYKVIDEKAIVNGIVGLLATGGSTNHTLHLVAIAAAAGIDINWDDFDELSSVVPLLCRIYPNGKKDVNHFHAAGGMTFLICELLRAGLLHQDVTTVWGKGLGDYGCDPVLDGHTIGWVPAREISSDLSVLAPVSAPFSPHGGLRVLRGNLGRAIMKTSALEATRLVVTAPAKVFYHLDDFIAAFEAGQLHQDFIAVVPYQGPHANGMPELHKLLPALGVLQGLGYKVGLVTDGRLSGASGKVPAAIHLWEEALKGGPIAKVQDGDLVTIDGEKGELMLHVEKSALEARSPGSIDLNPSHSGTGRELFHGFRHLVSCAEKGAAQPRGYNA